VAIGPGGGGSSDDLRQHRGIDKLAVTQSLRQLKDADQLRCIENGLVHPWTNARTNDSVAQTH
jgi:hypothetical protein